MANQPRPGSRKYTIRLDKEQVEALKTAQNRSEGLSDSAFLAELIKKGLEVPAPVPKVPAPTFSLNTAEEQLGKLWDRGGFGIVWNLMKAHATQIKEWEASQRLKGNW